MVLGELSEEREVGEFQYVGNLLYRHVRVAQIAFDVLHRRLMNPFKRRFARHRLRHERQILGRYAQFVGITFHRAHLAFICREQIGKLTEQQVGLLGLAAVVRILHMRSNDGKQLIYGALEEAVHYLLVEIAVGRLYLMRYD